MWSRSMRVSPPVLPAILALATGLAPAQGSQEGWTNIGGPGARQDHEMVYDPVRQRVLLVGGRQLTYGAAADDMWAWNGAGWQQVFSDHSPASGLGSYNHVLAFDRHRSMLLLFGGDYIPYQTWEWDGSDWTRRSPPNHPFERWDNAAVYDEARRVVVLFAGGRGETWEWDGVDWTRRQVINAPSLRYGPAMTYDSRRARVVLFGGGLHGNPLQDTWEWDGSAWTERATPARPPGRASHALAYDDHRGRIVLFGGYTGSSSLADTWEYDGATWIQSTPALAPSARSGHAMAFDSARRRTVLHGGNVATRLSGDTWEWDGTSWLPLPAGTMPTLRIAPGMAAQTSRGRVVLFGGYKAWDFSSPDPWSDETWELSGSAWHPLASPVRPAGRARPALASLSGDLMLFGGRDAQTELGDTWLFSNDQWSQVKTTGGPSPRQAHALAAEPGGGAVLFGGVRGTTRLGDTWSFDGQSWRQAQVPGPSPRQDHVLVHDPSRGRTVLFGGLDDRGARSDTWEWDGQRWTERRPSRVPPPRLQHAVAYDGLRRRILTFGGVDASYRLLRDTWEWDGNEWTLAATAVSPFARTWHAMAQDPASGRVVLFGGTNGLFLGDTWVYARSNTAEYAPFGAGCAGNLGVPSLAPGPGQLPWLGEPFTLEIRNVPGSLVLVLNGFSRTNWLGLFPLPTDLSPFGLTGCTLFVSGEVVEAARASAGLATWTLPLCRCPHLLGVPLFHQALVLDPGANQAGLTLSNAGGGRIGAR